MNLEKSELDQGRSLFFVGYQIDLRSNTGPLAEPSGQNTGNTVTTGLSGPAAHISDRLLTATEKQVHLGLLRMRPIHWHLKIYWKVPESLKKGDSNSQVPAPPLLTMVAKRRQCSHRPTITPNKTSSANIYRHIKRRVGRSLKRTCCKGPGHLQKAGCIQTIWILKQPF